MAEFKPEALVVGHLCLDLIPAFISGGDSVLDIFVPGKLINIDGMSVANGGAANNTGQALHRLGFPVRIVGKIGKDFLGRAILDNLSAVGPEAIADMIVSAEETSSFTVILNPPGIDRIFLHAEATNSTFTAAELPETALEEVKLMHFGYPPLMTAFCLENGVETKKLLERARAKNIVTTLDMARPDPESVPGKIDWPAFLENVLPSVDVFLPSIDEIIYMANRALFDKLLKKCGNGNMADLLDMKTISALADKMLALGPPVVGFKLGSQGFYLKTADDKSRLARIYAALAIDADAWTGKELSAPCFKAEVAGTTGAGDCTIAGFLGALLKGRGPEEAVLMAVAAGGASVEALDSSSGVKPWDEIKSRIAAGWEQSEAKLIPSAWKRRDDGVYSNA